MHIILDIHSLSGGVNGVGIGKKNENFNWFYVRRRFWYFKEACEILVFIFNGRHI